jgi:hypothetical protein
MAKKKSAPKIKEVPQQPEDQEAMNEDEPTSFMLPDGTYIGDKEKYSKAWLALGGGLCSLLGSDVKMHSFDPFVSVVWRDQMLLQLPADFVETIIHKFTYLMWENHNMRNKLSGGPQEHDDAPQEG